MKKDEAKKPPKPEKKGRNSSPIRSPSNSSETKPKKPALKFDANQVAALLDKREPQRQVATAATLNGAAALGAPTGHAAQLSQSELDALRAKLISLWNPPPAVSANPDQYVVTIHIRFTRDHRLVGQPQVLTAATDRCSRQPATARCAPCCRPALRHAVATTYDLWKDIEINFNPRELFGG